jgi:hypothetical protein
LGHLDTVPNRINPTVNRPVDAHPKSTRHIALSEDDLL